MNKQIKTLLLTLIFSINVNADDFILGGWTQHLEAVPRSGISHVQYGMVTELTKLTTGTLDMPGWSPVDTLAPKTYSKSPGSYGGALCSPSDMPSSQEQINKIVVATTENYWDGIDIDNECSMDIGNIIKLLNMLSQLSTSYTFLGGWDFNHPDESPSGKKTNDELKLINDNTNVDRFIMMTYDNKMWSMADIEANVGPGIERLIEIGISNKNIVASITTAGLNYENLNHMLDQVLKHKIAGLFIWDFESISPEHLHLIKERLSIIF